jgi:hypothetical protein
LEAFADLENDPDWQELADPWGFKDLLREEAQGNEAEP